MTTTLRIALAVLLAGHGVAHVPGFLVAWQLRAFPDLPYSTMAVNGMLDIGPTGTRILGALWLVTGVGTVAGGGAIFLRAEWAYPIVLVVLATSTIMCVLGWPGARLGLFANLLLAGLLVTAAMMDGRILPMDP